MSFAQINKVQKKEDDKKYAAHKAVFEKLQELYRKVPQYVLAANEKRFDDFHHSIDIKLKRCRQEIETKLNKEYQEGVDKIELEGMQKEVEMLQSLLNKDTK